MTFHIEPYQDIVRLTVTHEHLADRDAVNAVSLGWPAVMANLKSLLETGRPLPQPSWEMPAELVAGQMSSNDPAWPAHFRVMCAFRARSRPAADKIAPWRGLPHGW